MIRFKIRPYDVLFFGSGKPFHIGGYVRSIFPPFPHTFASAICAKIYAECKINVLGILKEIYGPFLYNEKNNKIYFPKPADIYTTRKGKHDKIYILKIPNEEYKLFKPENTNKPPIIEKFPIHIGEEEIEPFEGFISKEGLQKWIDGEEPQKDEIVKFEEIFDYEDRIGIKQNISTHTVVKEDGLYRIQFLRLKEDWSFKIWLEFDLKNKELESKNLNDEERIINFFNKEPRTLKLGGEMKNAYYDVDSSNIRTILKMPDKSNNLIKILFLTPGTFDVKNRIFPQILNSINIKSVISNGFAKLAINSKGLKLKKFLKKSLRPGSVIYAEIDDLENENFWFSSLRKHSKDYSKNFIGTNIVIFGI